MFKRRPASLPRDAPPTPRPPGPPRLADRLLNWLVAPHLREDLLGDLHEVYRKQVEEVGPDQARRFYWWQTITYLRPLIIKRKAAQPNEYPPPFLLSPAMIRNYVKIAWRNLVHAKSFSLINGFGLALGLASALLIFVVVHHETSYDQYHKNGDRMYRVETVNVRNSEAHAGTYTEMTAVLRNEVPEIERVVPIYRASGQSLAVPQESKSFKEPIAFTENGLFALLDYEWSSGDARTALLRPNQVVLTESYAQKFFGTTDAVGKTVLLGDDINLSVAGVLKDHPANTNFPFDVLVSLPTLKRISPDYDTHGWGGFGDNYQVYTLLRQGIRPEQLTKRFHGIQVKYQKDPETIKNQHFVLNSLAQLHYGYNFSGRQANVNLLNILSLIGAFVLLIACINFMNLTTAKALRRAKEIGIRKAVGSNRLALIYQFMTEAGLLISIATLLALLLAWVMLPSAANLMGLPLKTSDLFSWQAGAFVVLLVVLTTLLAGTYPAFRLSGMPPIWALKSNKLPQAGGSITFRQGLVVVQFTVSMILISSTLFINRQLSLFKNANLGFNQNAIITVGLPNNDPGKLQTLRSQLVASPQIKDVSFSFNSPSAESNWMQGIQYRNGTDPIEIRTQMKMVDAHFLETYGIQLIAGDAFREGDTLPKFIANEVFLKRLGIDRPEKAIGQMVYFGDSQESAPIIGVVKTFHVNSLHQGIDPTLMQVVPKHFHQAGIKLATENLSAETLNATLSTIETVWKATFPNKVFSYEFLDETLAQAYQNETRTAQLIETATLVAILIACLGLFGLATFAAESRTKEIGVRKVLGASVASIVALLSKDFLKPVLVAMLLAAPIAWYGVSEWLKNFEYKINIDWWVFAVAGAFAIMVALLTVSFQSIRAALMNPVKSLRTE
ncbi:Macrolide export ATP-binding/permease protein macB 1 [Fibrisoma limi BUZ 3]|uniref:Macrolide export ATP-binding/permease protein macB 1 n=1 Tax=Fibrisoma limi BUZ 3 TaxID=1185876 RepID=I2GET2_9BACT|nr:permease prefix domain 2-containing transporter [Fibrisoma limi]CCH52407.1 Macrolide export ATP-binding/permease protein macB 1 [Fibrisoma limi BUZ 3]